MKRPKARTIKYRCINRYGCNEWEKVNHPSWNPRSLVQDFYADHYDVGTVLCVTSKVKEASDG